LLRDLENLLAESGQGRTAPAVAAEHPTGSWALERLSATVREMTSDPAVRAAAGGEPVVETSADEIWGAAQRRLMRVSPELADRWHSRLLQELQASGVTPNTSRSDTVRSSEDRLVYPGLEGELSAFGLRFSTAAPLDPRIVCPGAGPDIELMARLVSMALWFCDHDSELHHCLQTVYRFGIVPVAGEQRDRYTEVLLSRWHRVAKRAAQEGSSTDVLLHKQSLIEWIELDEALQSLVYLPPVAASTWWGRLQGESRLALSRARDRAIAQGCQARLQRLAGPFPAISHLTGPDNLEVAHGTPGEVVACLRVFARIDGEELRGRVLYRPF
jgi:hypothetical protein